MVSFWPWKGDPSAADFEKTLSVLSEKISKTSAKNDGLRQNARKSKVWFTLWSVLVYTVAALVLILAVGYQAWGVWEWTGLCSGPVVIYGLRTGLISYYYYRTSNKQAYLDSLYKERDETIEKLKEATKFNSTQQLLEKYGAQPPKRKPSQKRKASGNVPQINGPPQPRTNMPPPPTANIQPPPTANIQRPGSQQGPDLRPHTPQQGPPIAGVPPSPGQLQSSPGLRPPPSSHSNAEFAPNAYENSALPYPETHWYDRLLDALLGEDESQAKNRIALLCQHCKLVNGQAPPGVKRLEDIGKWRCGACGGWNGVANETEKIMNEVREQVEGGHEEVSGEEEEDADVDADDASSGELVEKPGHESPVSKSTRSKKKGQQPGQASGQAGEEKKTKGKYEWNQEML